LHARNDDDEGREVLTELSLCYSMMVRAPFTDLSTV